MVIPGTSRAHWLILIPAIACWLLVPELLAAQVPPASGDFNQIAAQAAAAREAGRAEDAIRYYREGVKLRPQWDEGWWYLGSILYDTDQYADAVPAFNSLLQVNPNIGIAWNLLGLSEFETGDYGNSLAHLQKGQEIGFADNPGAVKVGKYHIALLLNANGKFEEAAKVLSEFAQGVAPQQVPEPIKVALGLALLRVPLLPAQLDPSRDAVVHAAGEIAALLAQGNEQQGLESFREMLKSNPDVPFLGYAYGMTLTRLGRNTDATKELAGGKAPTSSQIAKSYSRGENSVAVASSVVQAPAHSIPNHSVGNNSAEFKNLAAQAATARDAGRTADAIRDYEATLKLQPDWDEGLRYLGALDYAAGRFNEAIPVAKKLVEAHPEQGSAWALLGLSEFETKDYDNSRLHLQRAYELGVGGGAETVRLTAYRFALLLLRKGEFERAMGVLTPEAGAGPMSDAVRVAIGMALLRIGALPGELDSGTLELASSAGRAASLLLDSKYDEAFPIFEQMLKQHPQTHFLHYAYATALESLSRYDAARDQFRAETKVTPGSALPYTSLALIDLKLHQPTDAEQQARKATALEPESGRAHYALGRALLEQGNATGAVAELEAATRLQPNSPEAHFNLALAYARAKMPEKAQQERAAFARLNALVEQAKNRRGGQAYGSHERGALESGSGGAGATAPE